MRAERQIRALARYIAEELLKLFEERGVVLTTSNLEKEVKRWHNDGKGEEPLGPTNTDKDGESLLGMMEAKRITGLMTLKKKPKK